MYRTIFPCTGIYRYLPVYRYIPYTAMHSPTHMHCVTPRLPLQAALLLALPPTAEAAPRFTAATSADLGPVSSGSACMCLILKNGTYKGAEKKE
jgi:hypothetical protein